MMDRKQPTHGKPVELKLPIKIYLFQPKKREQLSYAADDDGIRLYTMKEPKQHEDYQPLPSGSWHYSLTGG